MEVLFKIFLYAHIASGTIGLLTGLQGMVTSKGSANHRLAGKVFLWAMTGVFITSVYMSIAHSNWFLFFIGFFSFYLAATGYRALATYRNNESGAIDYFIYSLGICAGLGLIYMSIFFVKSENAIVPALFGLISLSFGLVDLRSVVKGYNKANVYKVHGGRMAGAFTSTITAFVVVNISIEQQWILWIVPTFIITPISIYQIRKFTSKIKIV